MKNKISVPSAFVREPLYGSSLNTVGPKGASTGYTTIGFTEFSDLLEHVASDWAGTPITEISLANISSELESRLLELLVGMYDLKIKPDDVRVEIEFDKTDSTCLLINAKIQESAQFKVIDSDGNFWNNLRSKI